MKKLLKKIADSYNRFLDNLAFSRLKNFNLVEPYCLNHLKNMIHSVNDDYSKFKYKPFLVELKATMEVPSGSNINLTIPFLLDCIDVEDVKKVVENVRDGLESKDFFTRFNSKKNIHTNTEVGLLTEDFKKSLERQKLLIGYESFDEKVEKSKAKVKGTQFFLNVDLLSGITKIEKRQLPLLTLKPNYNGLEIEVENLYVDDKADEDKVEEVK